MRKLIFSLALIMSAAGLCGGCTKKDKDDTKDELIHGKYVPPVKSKIKPLKRFTCSVAGTLKKWRYNPTLSLLPDGRVLVAGGRQFDGKDWFNSVEIFAPKTSTFSPGKSMKTPRAMHRAISLKDGRIFIFSGMARELEVYDPARNSWRVVKKLKKELHGTAGVQLSDGKVFLAGGDPMGKRAFNTATFLWDPKTSKLSKHTELKQGQMGDAFLTKDGKVLLYSRSYDENKKSLRQLDLVKGTLTPFKGDGLLWKALQELSRMMGGEEVSLVRGPDGAPISPPTGVRRKILLRFFPSRMSWKTLAKLKYNHRDGAAVAFAKDKILVLGARDEQNSAAEICKP